jgi:cytochrome c-type biogenesis protein CcmH
MTLFLISAALMVVVALLFILPTLLRKDIALNVSGGSNEVNLKVLRDQLHEIDTDLAVGTLHAVTYESAKQELERRVAEDVNPDAGGMSGLASGLVKRQRWTALALLLAVPALAVSLYLLLGNPGGMDPAQVASGDPAHEVTDAQVLDMVAKLAERLKTKPDDVQGWQMLARSYSAIGRFDDAVDAYQHLITLIPDHADVLVDYADALAMKQNKTLQGEPEKLILHALAIDPKNTKGLALAGSVDFERGDYKNAVVYWKQILLLVPADSDIARSVMTSIGEAQSRLDGSGSPPIASAMSPQAPAQAATSEPLAPPESAAAGVNAAATITVQVGLDPALLSKVAPTDVVFIFARAAEGPRFPLAVLRRQVKDLPVSVVLDDSMSIMGDAKLSNFKRVIVGARVSKSGNATPTAGDYEGVSAPVPLGVAGLKVVIKTLHE